ncbi:MAG: L-aspartate oxidase [Gammaproteobacteria bacterium]|nr:L-aspartate oxidase [Rhodocyclaceae bacterium]MBU3907917.1 L-aspartate oxidase [Gammaproteobacteria bacterium]MBU3989618.1 L-aspartate oxidase [Gammaproteobacteria bacterium]MBU4003823.1 L-aspartate oxidase [Gammaproteobacteria bacterium]MBU4021701.1 L-aspartate oxidase [Gammaproteobacteria bacterium]
MPKVEFLRSFDAIVIGSGLAGQSLALRLADTQRVVLVTKRMIDDSATNQAQGGIAAVLDDTDSIESHVQDTLTAGAGLCDPVATRFVVEHGHAAIDWLIEQGVPFTRSDSGYHLTREGGHSTRRVIHVADATGASVQQTLSQKVRQHPNITVLERHIVVDLITGAKLGHKTQRCWGAYVLDIDNERVLTLGAPNTVIASGGAGKSYLYTSNPDTATGDGIAMAWRAGCRVSNMEFIQFHPTCLHHPQAKSFLITEAMRGEGGILRLPASHGGTRFMLAHDERAELAPRDIVARAIDYEMKRHGLDCVFLDMTHKGESFMRGHFPNIYARCLELGIDIAKQPIPVVPAAHYTCGGIVVDLAARTDVPGLYALGEAACTGLHGANRLASNSLLECVVFSAAAATDILAQKPAKLPRLPRWDESRVTDADEEIVISHNWDELRRFMWDYVGIVRTNKRLERARHRIRLLEKEITEFYSNFRVSNDLIELRNLVQTAHLIVECALKRKESRGLHFSRDYPETLPRARNTILKPRP